MQLLELTLKSPAGNIALDEALVEQADQSNALLELLRIWEPEHSIVVLGRSSKVADEVILKSCRKDNVEVIRRTSGGATILAGPGCLMYGLILSYELRPELRSIERAHSIILDALALVLSRRVHGIHRAGISDLVTRDKLKFSGNSMRCLRGHLLYHGTVLYDFPLERMSRYLSAPPREPDYRRGREHANFVANLPLPREEIRRALIECWDTRGNVSQWPEALTEELIQRKYSCDDWNLRH